MTASERREHLLDVARGIVLDEGFYAVTFDRVAREAGVTRPLLYKQFGDLPGLVSALVDRETATAMQGLAEVLATVPPGGKDAATVHAVMELTLDTVAASPDSWRILFNPPQGGPSELYERIAAGQVVTRDAVQSVVAAIAADAADAELTSHLVHLQMEELVRLHLADPERYPAKRVLREVDRVARRIMGVVEPADSPR